MESHITGIIHTKLKAAGLPVIGMGFPSVTDRTTWRIDWDGTPTAGQLAQAQAIIDALDIPVEEAKATEEQGIARAEIIARGIGRVLVAKGLATQAEIKAAIKAEWDSQ